MRIIDADKLLSDKNISAYPAFRKNLAGISDLKAIVDECETLSIKHVKHGRWKKGMSIFNDNVCSVCNCISRFRTAYCPHCGAKMDAEDE